MTIFGKIIKAVKEGGFKLLIERFIRVIYFKLSPILPQKYGEYNGVKVPSYKFFGRWVPRITINNPSYEKGIVNSMDENINEGDNVVILGGGYGVTAVTATKLTGSPKNVRVFEGSKDQITKVEKTFQKNNVSDIDITHAVVGPNIDVWGDTNGAENVTPNELPECDVLEMDIEGSEKEVLKNLEIRPRVLIVESHGSKNSPTEKVKELMNALSYKIENVEIAEDKKEAKENDIMIITGLRNN